MSPPLLQIRMRSPKLKLCHKPSLIDELCDEAKWKTKDPAGISGRLRKERVNGPCRWVTVKETENLEAVNVEAPGDRARVRS